MRGRERERERKKKRERQHKKKKRKRRMDGRIDCILPCNCWTYLCNFCAHNLYAKGRVAERKKSQSKAEVSEKKKREENLPLHPSFVTVSVCMKMSLMCN